MSSISNREMTFVVAVLYSLPEKWRGVGRSFSFEDVQDRLHLAWHRLYQEGLLGEFGESFSFDALCGSDSLGQALRTAAVDGLIRIGGSDMAYHVDVLKPDQIDRMLESCVIDRSAVTTAVKRLEAILEEKPSPA